MKSPLEENEPLEEHVRLVGKQRYGSDEHHPSITTAAAAATETETPHVHTGLKLFQATAINVMNMFGTGPFITFPLLLATMNGPESLLGYVLATTLAICDGLVWAELGTSLPEAGGTYSYLLQGFGAKKWGRLMAFLFVWQMIVSGPLEIASGYVGVAQYFSYLWRSVSDAPAVYSSLVAAGVGLINIFVVYRDLQDVNKITAGLFAVMLFTIIFVSITGFVEFSPSIAFHTPPPEGVVSKPLIWGLMAAMRVGVYDFSGYYEVCYMGSEIENPGRVIPLAVIGSVMIVVTLFLSVDFAVIGVVPWTVLLPIENASTGPFQFPIAYFLEVAFPKVSKVLPVVFVLVLALTVYGSSFTMLLGYSRIPFAASADGNFLPWFDKLHPTKEFPYISVLIMGFLSTAACFLNLDTLINALITARILVQYVAQIVALTLLRRRTDIKREFSVWFYPIPNIIALVFWLALFFTAEAFVIFGTIGSIVVGVLLFLAKSRYMQEWPFFEESDETYDELDDLSGL